MEPLGDRVMLSVAPGDAPTAGEVLVGIIKAEFSGEDSLYASELAVLQTLTSLNKQNPQLRYCATGKHINKAVITLRQIDNVFYKFSIDLIKGDLTEDKINKLQSKLSDEFATLDEIVQDFGTGDANPLLPAVQNLEHKATSLFTDLSKLDTVAEAPREEQQALIKIARDFMLGDSALNKVIEGALLARKAGKGQQEFLTIKMNDVLVTSASLSDPKLAGQLQDLAEGVLNLAATLGQPGVDGSTGVTLVNNTGDTITGP